MSRGPRKTVRVASAPPPVGPYPHARIAGPLLFLSGIGPRQPGSGEVPGLELDDTGRVLSYDFASQCEAALENVRRVLEASGSSLDQVVDVTAFLTDLRRDFDTFNRIYGTYFGDDGPARTTVEVSRLPTPIAVELKCTALLVSAEEKP